MRFRQAMSVLAQAMEAASTLHPDASSALCSVIGHFHDLERNPGRFGYNKDGVLKDTQTYSSTFHWRGAVANLCMLAGVQAWHMRRLDEHINRELRKSPHRAYLPGVWHDTGRFGIKLDSEAYRDDARRARCEWLRTLGRTAPAKVKHAAE